MSYNYKDMKNELFTESGQVMFIAIRDNVKHLLRQAGAVRFQEATKDVSGDVWMMIACFDRMVELGELHEITGDGFYAQHRVFVEE